jgi:hypothetical protein
MMEWFGWHPFSGCLEYMQGKAKWCAGHSRGASKLRFFLKKKMFSYLEAGRERRMVETWSTFACFDFARLDFFLLMIVLNQSPDPMTNRGTAQQGDQFLLSSTCLYHTENEGQ